MMTCPHCGGSHPATARFCPISGKPIPQPSKQTPPPESHLFSGVDTRIPKEAPRVGSFLFMRLVIQALSRGSVFRRATAISLYVSAVAIGIFGLLTWIQVWEWVKEPLENAPPISLLGVIVFQLLLAVGIYAVVHTIFIRARNVLELPEGEFTIIPIASLLTKLTGEVVAISLAVSAVGGGILIWFLGPQAQRELPFGVLPFLDLGASFVGGLASMVLGLLLAYGLLVFSYWISEAELVLVAIARNTEVMRRVAERYEQAEMPAAQGLHPSPRAGS
jgi:hypothetical protein